MNPIEGIFLWCFVNNVVSKRAPTWAQACQHGWRGTSERTESMDDFFLRSAREPKIVDATPMRDTQMTFPIVLVSSLNNRAKLIRNVNIELDSSKDSFRNLS